MVTLPPVPYTGFCCNSISLVVWQGDLTGSYNAVDVMGCLPAVSCVILSCFLLIITNVTINVMMAVTINVRMKVTTQPMAIFSFSDSEPPLPSSTRINNNVKNTLGVAIM